MCVGCVCVGGGGGVCGCVFVYFDFLLSKNSYLLKMMLCLPTHFIHLFQADVSKGHLLSTEDSMLQLIE